MASNGSSRNKSPYVSFNPTEFACLRQVGFRERWLYSELKWKANFKTGVVGNFYKECLSYAQLAELVTVPAEQGRDRGLCSIDDKEAARILERLERIGLVANIHRNARGGLAFTLPLSPIGVKADDTTPATVIEAEEMLPDGWGDENPAEPQQMGPDDSIDNGRSVLGGSKEFKIFNTGISILPAADTAASAPPETPPPDVLTLTGILNRLRTSKARFVYLETETSLQTYAGWIERKVPWQAIEQAISRIEFDDSLRPTPTTIDTLLRNARRKTPVNPRNGHRSANWGRVWL